MPFEQAVGHKRAAADSDSVVEECCVDDSDEDHITGECKQSLSRLIKKAH